MHGESPHQLNTATTNFQDSVTFYMEAANYGVIRNNTINWLCSAYDMDTSSNIVFEDNTIRTVEAGWLPHGNSVSMYNLAKTPSTANWSYSHNTLTRPRNNSNHNWAFHETYTTDGTGGYGSGACINTAGPEITVGFLTGPMTDVIGTTCVVVSGYCFTGKLDSACDKHL
eukprot:m.783360 g.783360  ORF g.783360 m.783360 type:complete len:170 (-) comp23294_c0_seq10:1482-1991(-)